MFVERSTTCSTTCGLHLLPLTLRSGVLEKRVAGTSSTWLADRHTICGVEVGGGGVSHLEAAEGGEEGGGDRREVEAGEGEEVEVGVGEQGGGRGAPWFKSRGVLG